MPLLKKTPIPPSSHAEALAFAISCEMLWAICFHPQRILLKNFAAQLQNLYFKSLESWIFSRTPQPSFSLSPAVLLQQEAWPGEHGAGALRSQAELGKKPQTHNSLGTCVFLFKLNPLLAMSQAKVRKRTIKCLSNSFYFKGSDIKLVSEQLLSGMRTADESLFLSSSVFKAKVPYWKRRL